MNPGKPIPFIALIFAAALLSGCDILFPNPGGGCELESFAIAAPYAAGAISGGAVAVQVPSGTDKSALVATFASTGARVSVAGIDQVSGVTVNDFRSPLTYTVTAEDGSSKDYVVTVTSPDDSAHEIESFGFVDPAASGTIVGSAITVTVPHGTSLGALVASFATTGASVKVGGVEQTSGVTANDFSAPLSYVVSARDGSARSYTVGVRVADASDKRLTSFSIAAPAAEGTIDQAAHTIDLTVPYGTALGSLVAVFAFEGSSVRVGPTVQASGVSANSFSSPIAYTVVAADGSTVDYTVTVSVAAPQTGKSMLSFSFAGVATGSIDEPNGRILIAPPSGTSVSWRAATFTLSAGAVARVGSTAQVSGATSNNFNASVVYAVTAQDGSTRNYTVYTLLPASSVNVHAQRTNKIYVSWSRPATSESGWIVERSADGASWTQMAFPASGSEHWIDGSASVGTAYAYRVAANCPAGRSLDASSSPYALPPAPGALSFISVAPVGTKAILTPGPGYTPHFKVGLTWQGGINTDAFEVYASSDQATWEYQVAVPAAGPGTYQWFNSNPIELPSGGSGTEMREGTAYYFAIDACNAASATRTVVAWGPTLFAPVYFSHGADGWNAGAGRWCNPVLRWDSYSALATQYDIYFSTDNVSYGFLASVPAAAPSGTPTYQEYTHVYVAAPGTPLYYKIKARNADGSLSSNWETLATASN